MALYQTVTNNPALRWRFFLDATDLFLGRDLVFVQGEPISHRDSLLLLHEREWKKMVAQAQAKGQNLYDGPLARFNGLDLRASQIRVVLSPSSYQEHHATMPIEGRSDFEQRRRHFVNSLLGGAYSVTGYPSVRIENFGDTRDKAPAFALAVLVETSDKKLIYGVRNGEVDCYKGQWSLPSGGRIGGNPHEFITDVVSDPQSFYSHVAQLLQLEFPGISDLEARVNPLEAQFTGILRSLYDFDTTGTVRAEIDATSDQLAQARNTRKYQAVQVVPATGDGIITLLQNCPQFASTVFGTIVMAAPHYCVDPTTISIPTHQETTVRIEEMP